MRYSFTVDHVHYVANQDGSPLTLPQIWRFVEGCGNVRIWCGERLVLDRAGAQTERRYRIRRRYIAMRELLATRRRESYAALSGIPHPRRREARRDLARHGHRTHIAAGRGGRPNPYHRGDLKP